MVTEQDSSFVDIETLAGPAAFDGVVIRCAELPRRSYGSRIREFVDNPTWNRLRIPVCEAAGNRCEMCGSEVIRNNRPGRPDCHERWTFEFGPDGTAVQSLKGFVALCPGCHQTQHLSVVRNDEQRRQEVVERLCDLNDWTEAEAESDIRRSGRRARWLGGFGWDLDLTVLAGLVVLPGDRALYVAADDRARLIKR